MRDAFCQAITDRLAGQARRLFLTGDLGFGALEKLRDEIGDRFMNVGISEQNMASMAAGLCYSGFETWIYSIAPFVYARPFEQVRNDIAFHGLPVKLVGNGGGFGYGVMGATHYALDDYGAIGLLPNFKVFIPAFDEDVPECVSMAGESEGPVYLRLGRSEKPATYCPQRFSGWRCMIKGASSDVVICVGPMVGEFLSFAETLPFESRPAIWSVGVLPLLELPTDFLSDIEKDGVRLFIVEEHVRQGGVAQQLALKLLLDGVTVKTVLSYSARSAFFENYGSHRYMRRQEGLTPAQVLGIPER
jgi:transketolase